MASLVEELVNILEAEQKVYETLTGYEEKKKDVLIRADVPALEEITNLEQLAGDELIAYSNKQVQALTDIATVLGRVCVQKFYDFIHGMYLHTLFFLTALL